MATYFLSSDLSTYSPILMLGLLFIIMYFVMIRPQKKNENQLKEMRNKLEIGDEITTIGGIVGRVISMKEDYILIETGTDRTKLRLKRWSVQSVEKVELD